MKILLATTPDEIQIARNLLLEYWESFGFDPTFQGFADEVAGLPGKYTPPGGRLALALVDDQPAGCIALRPVDSECGEIKRLYIRQQFRGRGIGWDLLLWLIAEARGAGYRELVCDTMPPMKAALRMYEAFGFQRTGPYGLAPTPGAIYLRLELEQANQA